MRNKLLFTLLSLCQTMVFGQIKFTFNEWQDPSVFRVGTLTQHAFFIPFADEKQALSDKWLLSNQVLSLDGTWKFHFANRFADRAQGFENPTFDVSKWANIKVPSDWQMEGFDVPIFSNIVYPWAKKANPPFIPPHFTPVGSYRRSFDLPINWEKQRVVLHFGGVNSAYYVWVNGQPVGYAEDSKMDAEFDVSKIVKAGKNEIAVQVLRFADGTYLEDQDFWRLSGIEREVYLVATPKTFVQDIATSTVFKNGFSEGILKTVLSLENQDISAKKTQVSVKLLDKNKQDVGKIATANTPLSIGDKKDIPLDISVKNPLLWSAETPNLYTAIITLSDEKGKVLQIFNQQIGFRQVEIKNGQVLVNGQPVLFKGVNRHEHHPEKGHALVDEADMLLDIQRMKEFNINAVRTCHYPNHPLWYKLCNQYGLYMVDEANVESHGMGVYDYKPYGYAMNNILARDSTWFPATWQRIYDMYERDKNQPAIIFWSLGNEAGRGDNFKKAHAALKKLDASRPVQYEQAFMDDYTDIVAPMYPRLPDLEKYAQTGDKRPYIMCEFAHSMGNSTGNFKEYWDFIEANRQFQGGFIWDWKNQTFSKKTAEGLPYWAFSHDLEPAFMSADGCSDGLVFGDGSPEPALEEVKKIYQHIKFTNFDAAKGSFRLRNGYYFRNLDNLSFTYHILKDGKVAKEGVLNVPSGIKPQQEITVSIPDFTQITEGGEIFVNIHAKLKTDEPLLKTGHSLAAEQFLVKEIKPKMVEIPTIAAANFAAIDTSDTGFTWISAKDFTLTFDKKTGFLSAWLYKNKHLLKEPLMPDFWRAPINNDLGNNMVKRCAVWKNIEARLKVKAFEVTAEKGVILVKTVSELTDSKSEIAVVYTIFENGTLQVAFDFKTEMAATNDKKQPEIPRIGMRLTTFSDYENLTWYGRGPHENYWDRNQSSFVGVYSGKVKDQFIHYEVPQENGTKTDVRWCSLTNAKGGGLTVKALTTWLDINAQNYKQSDMEGKTHTYQVPLSNLVELHIDYRQMGIGGDNSWGNLPMEKYLLYGQKYSYAFLMQPMD